MDVALLEILLFLSGIIIALLCFIWRAHYVEHEKLNTLLEKVLVITHENEVQIQVINTKLNVSTHI